MQAIILAAGMGKRLGEYTHDNTKCMLEVNGVRLIDRALDALKEVGVSRIVLVVGYKGQNVKDYVGDYYADIPIKYVENPIYDKTNNIYSLYLAKGYLLSEDSLLLESDIIFEPSIIKKLVDNPFPNLALVDKFESWMDGTVVKIDDDNRIIRLIDKSRFHFDDINEYYKTVNIYKFSKDFSERYYVPFLIAYSTALGDNEYYEQVLRIILHLQDAPLRALPLSGERWYEIDDAQDLDIASGMFAPSDDQYFKAISSRFGGYWRYPKILDFCYLANPYFPPQRLIDEMKSNFEVLMREYPSGMRVNSLLAAKYFGVNQDFILIGNGAAELIKELMENWTGILGNILPTFEEYPNRKDNDHLIQYIPVKEGFKYSADEIMDYFEDKDIDSLLLINPDNPSGNYIPFEDLLKLLDWTKKKCIRFIIDESFVDFAKVDGQFSLFDNTILSNNEHLVVVKSISKSYGIPGFRLGVLASGNKDLIRKMKRQVAIWNINSFGEFYMQIFEKYRSDYHKACEQFKKERELFYEELKTIPYLEVYPSQANYFLCYIKETFTSHELALKLLKQNILIKDCSTKNGFNEDNYIRLAIRDRKDNHYLIEVLRSI
jgi:histidinol-phosphate/aromatic aminotransferase/cobyric acid decarboxylase-like protein/CTP:phosphocholine cytidylyltransferase-like protein